MEPLHDEMSDVREHVRGLLTQRRSPEARALFERISRFVYARVAAVSRHCGQALVGSEQEEVVADVLVQLLQGSLAGFRGRTVPELLGFIRTVTDRTTWRVIRRRDRERRLLQKEAVDIVESWSARLPAPDRDGEREATSPLPEADQAYLIRLLQAGSKAELARSSGVSRAAVTQRVQRIRSRVAEMGQNEQAQHEVWLTQAARQVVRSERPEPVDA